MAAGIPSARLKAMRNAMSQLDLFDDYGQVKKIFAECENLQPWEYSFPWSGSSRMSRIEILIAFLFDKNHVSGANALDTFLLEIGVCV